MSMSKAFFKAQMEMIAGAYLNEKYSGDAILRVWYGFFAEIPEGVFQDNVRFWIKSKTNAPTIAELLRECRGDM